MTSSWITTQQGQEVVLPAFFPFNYFTISLSLGVAILCSAFV